MKQLPEVNKLLEEGKYEEAYDYLTTKLEEKPNDIQILYTRGIIDCVHIKKHIGQTILDFEYIVSKSKKLTPVLYPFLTILSDINDDHERVIKYGELCKLDEDNPMVLDINWALSRAYYLRSDYESYKIALDYINKCLAMAEEDIEDFYYCKCEILSALDEVEELEKLLNTCYLKFGGGFNYYYLNVRLYIIKIRKKLNNENIDEYITRALENADIAVTYNPEEEYKLITLKVDLYCIIKQYDKAVELVDSLNKWFDPDDVLVEKLKIYEELQDYETVKKLSREFLENNQSWKIEYSLGYALEITPSTEEDLIESKQLLESSYNTSKKMFIISDLYRVNKQLRKDYDNFELITPLLLENPNNGGLYNLMGETIQRLNYPYKEIIKCYELAYKYKWISEFEYLDDLLPLIDNPKKLNKKLKKYQLVSRELLSGWMKRRIGIKYLYGENDYPINMELSKIYLEEALNEFPNVSCYHATMGRFYEFNNNHSKAIEEYDKGYLIYTKELKPLCNCAAGYLAHAYIQGIGVEKDIEKAKQIILSSIDEAREVSCSTVIYFYAYFYLNDHPEFNGLTAKELLELSYPFDRHEISRVIYLKQVNDKLNIIDKSINKRIKDVKKGIDKKAKDYLKKSLREKVSYPYIGNF